MSYRKIVGAIVGAAAMTMVALPAMAFEYLGARQDWHVFQEEDPETGAARPRTSRTATRS